MFGRFSAREGLFTTHKVKRTEHCVTLYTGLLQEQYVNLSTKLDAHIVAVHMFQRNALTLKELQSIQCLRDRPVEAAETLLNVIMEQPDAVYLCFLDVLKGTEQQHIYQTLVETGYRGHYLPTVILIVIGIPLLTHSFIPNFFLQILPTAAFPFLPQYSLHGFPQTVYF